MDISRLQFRDGDPKKDGTAVEERSLLQSEVSTAQRYFARHSAETLPLFRKKCNDQMLRDFLDYDTSWKDGNFAERTIMASDRLDAWAWCVGPFLQEKEKCGGGPQIKIADI